MVLNYILFENIVWKKVVYTIKFYLQILSVAGYLKSSNDTLKLNIHKHTNYNIIEIYINRLSTATQIFIAMDYLKLKSEKNLHFRKRQKHLAKTFFFPPHKSNWIHALWKYFSNYLFLKDTYKNLKEIRAISKLLSKLTISVNLWIFKLYSSLH